MTFDEYIVNPMGKNNAVMSAITRELIRKDYTYRFNNLLLRENGKIDYTLYRDKKNNVYYAHIKVPSEVVPKFYYDVVIRFFTSSDKDTEGGRNLEKYQVQFFSNDPAFVYTYAHVFIANDMFVKDLLPKMSRMSIKYEAKIKNPKGETGYVKSIYFTYLFMKERGFFKTVKYGEAIPYNKNLVLPTIEEADSKIAARQKEGQKIGNRKKLNVDASTASKLQHLGVSDKAMSRLAVETNKVSKVKNTSMTKVIKPKSKNIKSIKKV